MQQRQQGLSRPLDDEAVLGRLRERLEKEGIVDNMRLRAETRLVDAVNASFHNRLRCSPKTSISGKR